MQFLLFGFTVTNKKMSRREEYDIDCPNYPLYGWCETKAGKKGGCMMVPCMTCKRDRCIYVILCYWSGETGELVQLCPDCWTNEMRYLDESPPIPDKGVMMDNE